ncbi:MAG: hypothetical protein P4L47_23860 [Mucilaginibacter sp.]|nr:hypothetical protein [Mucilaginibacter sp.]
MSAERGESRARAASLLNIMALWDGFGGVVERCGRTIISYYVKVSGGCAMAPEGSGQAVRSGLVRIASSFFN